MKNGEDYDAIADLHRKVSTLQLEAHDREHARKGDEDERFGRLLSGAMREHQEHAKQEREEGDAKRHEELLAHLHAIGDRLTDSHEKMMASHEATQNSMRELTEALKAHTASRDGEIEVRKTGTVQTPQGEHKMNVLEIHRRKNA